MLSDLAISVEDISKCYHVYSNPRDRLKQFFLPRINRIFSRHENNYHNEFWALKDVSLQVRRGETLGIVGRNGSGKSTLLQIICGTLTPTSGIVRTQGRIAALLELGSGFNPEFTGRENVYMNAAILGLSRSQTDSIFDEVQEFAEIGDFMDQPVKVFSSGMAVRLAFAVQACVDPEILVVDEALAVGDIGFQYKCFKRMSALKEKGVTILMVTHSAGSILEYADRCVVLQNGSVVQNTDDVLAAILSYEKGVLGTVSNSASSSKENIRTEISLSYSTVNDLRRRQEIGLNSTVNEKRFGSARAIIDEVSIVSSDSEKKIGKDAVFKSGDEVVFKLKISAAEAIENVVLGVSLSKAQGADIWGDNNLFAGELLSLRPGDQWIHYTVRLPISSGDYLLHCGLACFVGEAREELDQRRPVAKMTFWSPREQVGVVHAPALVSLR